MFAQIVQDADFAKSVVFDPRRGKGFGEVLVVQIADIFKSLNRCSRVGDMGGAQTEFRGEVAG